MRGSPHQSNIEKSEQQFTGDKFLSIPFKYTISHVCACLTNSLCEVSKRHTPLKISPCFIMANHNQLANQCVRLPLKMKARLF